MFVRLVVASVCVIPLCVNDRVHVYVVVSPEGCAMADHAGDGYSTLCAKLIVMLECQCVLAIAGANGA